MVPSATVDAGDAVVVVDGDDVDRDGVVDVDQVGDRRSRRRHRHRHRRRP